MPARPNTTREDMLARSPAMSFERPQDVLTSTNLSHEEKRRVLLRWKDDAIALQIAADENMAGGERSMLEDVVTALNTLETQ